MTVTLPAGLLRDLEAHARAAQPFEACALLLGAASATGGVEITDIAIAQNVTDADPKTCFEVDPVVHLGVQKASRAGGPGVVGVWHSHPNGAPGLSETDRARSTMPGWVWLVTAVGDGPAETRAFRAGYENPSRFGECALALR